MLTLSYTDFRARLAAVWDQVVDDREEAVITRNGHESVVLVAEREWASIQETLYLLRTPAAAIRLLNSIAEAEAGHTVEGELIIDGPEVHEGSVDPVHELGPGHSDSEAA